MPGCGAEYCRRSARVGVGGEGDCLVRLPWGLVAAAEDWRKRVPTPDSVWERDAHRDLGLSDIYPGCRNTGWSTAVCERLGMGAVQIGPLRRGWEMQSRFGRFCGCDGIDSSRSNWAWCGNRGGKLC